MTVLSRLESWLLPYHCIACDKLSDRDQDLCSDCYKQLPRLIWACQQCANPLPAHNAQHCANCLKQAPAFDSTIAALQYSDKVPYFIKQFKQHHKMVYGRVLSELLAEKHAPLPQAFIPMPLHWWRHLWRGYNQAYVIAKILGQHHRIPVCQQYLKRHRTSEQKHLSKRLREKNTENAFHLACPVPYQHVAIVDDVMTTGKTAHSLAHTLKQAGVARVDVWVIARTPLSFHNSAMPS